MNLSNEFDRLFIYKIVFFSYTLIGDLMKKILQFYLVILLFISCPILYLGFVKNEVKAIEVINAKYIYIDPGHGGIDGGGMSKDGIYEKDINLKISYFLKDYLENSGYLVLLTRYGDYDLANKQSTNRKREDILKRVDILNNDNILLYISIHCNIYTNNTIRGAQTFYNSKNENNKKLAESIQTMFINVLKNTTRKAKSITDKYLIDNCKNNGCLVEVGFLSNDEEKELLSSSTYQEQLAYCIYIGIIQYLGINNNL